MLGTNSLEGLDFKITHSDGSVVDSETTGKKGETVSPNKSMDESITNTKDCRKSLHFSKVPFTFSSFFHQWLFRGFLKEFPSTIIVNKEQFYLETGSFIIYTKLW